VFHHLSRECNGGFKDGLHATLSIDEKRSTIMVNITTTEKVQRRKAEAEFFMMSHFGVTLPKTRSIRPALTFRFPARFSSPSPAFVALIRYNHNEGNKNVGRGGARCPKRPTSSRTVLQFKVRLLGMAKDVAAVVAAAYPSRGIGYQGMLVSVHTAATCYLLVAL
jgi:hypothetical protein